MSRTAAKEGSKGKPTVVHTNSFEITRLPVKRFYHYDVVVTPDLQNNLRRGHELMDRLQTREAPQIFNPRAVYDGRANLFSSHELRLPGGGSGSFNVQMSDRPPRPGSGPPRGVFTVKITRAAASAVEPSELNDLIRGGKESARTKTATNLLQLLICAAPNIKYPHNSRSYFTPAGKKEIGGGMEIWTGFFQSVRPSIGRMLVNIDVSIAVMYKPGSLLAVSLEILNRRNVRDLELDEGSPDFRKLKSMLNFVLVTVQTDTKRKRSIKGLVSNVGAYRFEKTDQAGRVHDTTVAAYYMEAHNIRLQYPRAFGIRVGSLKSNVILPAELCTVIEGQIYKKKVSPELTRKVVEAAKRRPDERLRTITSGLDGRVQVQTPALEYQNSDFIRDAQMAISPDPVTISGRVLETPHVSYERDSKKPNSGSWNVLGSQFNRGANLVAWGVINFASTSLSSEIVRGFIQMLEECCKKLGMNVGPMLQYFAPSPDGARGHLDAFGMRVTELAREKYPTKNFLKPELIIVILPQSAADIRRAVKQWGDVAKGVATQCIREDKIKRVNSQYCNNVALKVNVRLGGLNSTVRSPVMEKLRRSSPYMIVGADISHPAPGMSNEPSISSLVWSHDQFASEYVAYSNIQQPRQEEFGMLEPMMLRALQQFAMKNSVPPLKIIFFRDGVSEGEYEAVVKNEIAAIKAAIDGLWKSAPKGTQVKEIKLTFIVVGKRHHVRFFPRVQQDADRSGNCPAGFIADKGLSSPFAFDFYLLSHGGLLGTSRPAHYIVLEDKIFDENVDDLQELAFSLCHVYARATRSVSIPAPVYYADLVCARGKDFYFDDELRLHDDATTVSSGAAPFDIRRWTDGYYGNKINKALDKTMYFL